MQVFDDSRVVKSIEMGVPYLKPLGVNKWHDIHYIRTGKYSKARTATIGKSSEAKRFQVSLEKYLKYVYSKELAEFESCYDPYKHELFTILTTYMPKKKLITTKNTINKKSGDVDGFPKLTVDSVFELMPKLDDAFNQGCLSLKDVSDQHCVKIEIFILNRPLRRLNE
jgi:hypothetical protein